MNDQSAVITALTSDSTELSTYNCTQCNMEWTERAYDLQQRPEKIRMLCYPHFAIADNYTLTCRKCGAQEGASHTDQHSRSLGAGFCGPCYQTEVKESKLIKCIRCEGRFPRSVMTMLKGTSTGYCNECQQVQQEMKEAEHSEEQAGPIVADTLPVEVIHRNTDNDGNDIELYGMYASNVKTKPLHWIWPQRFPAGNLSLLTGKPGLGKTTIATDMIARISTGKDWPDGPNTLGPRKVLLASSEDDPERTLVPRLMAAGADLSKVIILTHLQIQKAARNEHGNLKTVSKAKKQALMLSTCAKVLKSVMKQNPDIALIVLDPLTAFLGVDSNKDALVRPIMQAAVDIVAGRDAALVGIMHLNKKSDVGALEKVLGASSLVGVVRAAWMVGRDPDDPENRYMAHAKGNLSKNETGLRFKMEETTLTLSTGEETQMNFASWLESMDESADDMLGKEREKARGKENKTQKAEEFLQRVLKDGPVDSRELETRAEEEGLHRSTIWIAKKVLGINTMKQGKKWMWALPLAETLMPDTDIM